MGKERQNEGEKSIDPSKVPFEWLKEGEKAMEYPDVYLSHLEESWTRVCELMEWENLPWEAFLSAKDPEKVVSLIQEKLVLQGEDLGEQGVDGKFGSHTRSAVDNWKAKKEFEKALQTVEKEIEEPLSGISEITLLDMGKELRESQGNIMEFMKTKKFEQIMEMVERMDEEFERAGLKVDLDEAEKFTQEQRNNYKKRCRAFRENLVAQEPRLKPLLGISEKLIVFIEKEMRNMDFSGDPYKMMEEFFPKLQKEMGEYINNKESQQLDELMQNLDLETLMTFFMSAIHEIKVSLAGHFKGQKKAGFLLKKIEEEDFDGFRIEKEEIEVWQNSGKIKFWYKGRRFVVDLDKGKMRRGLKSLFKNEQILGCRLVGKDFVEIQTISGVKRLTRDELVKMK